MEAYFRGGGGINPVLARFRTAVRSRFPDLLSNDFIDIIAFMPSITIRNLEASVKSRLRVRAARHGRSMEEEAREILRGALAEKEKRPTNLLEAMRRRIAPLGGVELFIPARGPMREPPRFEE